MVKTIVLKTLYGVVLQVLCVQHLKILWWLKSFESCIFSRLIRSVHFLHNFIIVLCMKSCILGATP